MTIAGSSRPFKLSNPLNLVNQNNRKQNITKFQGVIYLRKMLDYDNHPEIQCQDPEIVDVQVYHTGHHKGQAHL